MNAHRYHQCRNHRQRGVLAEQNRAIIATTSSADGAARVIEPRTILHSTHCDRNDEVESSDSDEEEEEAAAAEEEDPPQRPYKNRSLFWTNNFRTLIPYDKARSMAIGLGVATKEEYQFYRKGPYMICDPEEMYYNDWVGWDEFLGVMRPYDETKEIVQKILRLRDMDAYVSFVKDHTKRASGLRIPAKPDVYYKRSKEWKSFDDFFGTFQ